MRFGSFFFDFKKVDNKAGNGFFVLLLLLLVVVVMMLLLDRCHVQAGLGSTSRRRCREGRCHCHVQRREGNQKEVGKEQHGVATKGEGWRERERESWIGIWVGMPARMSTLLNLMKDTERSKTKKKKSKQNIHFDCEAAARLFFRLLWCHPPHGQRHCSRRNIRVLRTHMGVVKKRHVFSVAVIIT